MIEKEKAAFFFECFFLFLLRFPTDWTERMECIFFIVLMVTPPVFWVSIIIILLFSKILYR